MLSHHLAIAQARVGLMRSGVLQPVWIMSSTAPAWLVDYGRDIHTCTLAGLRAGHTHLYMATFTVVSLQWRLVFLRSSHLRYFTLQPFNDHFHLLVEHYLHNRLLLFLFSDHPALCSFWGAICFLAIDGILTAGINYYKANTLLVFLVIIYLILPLILSTNIHPSICSCWLSLKPVSFEVLHICFGYVPLVSPYKYHIHLLSPDLFMLLSVIDFVYLSTLLDGITRLLSSCLAFCLFLAASLYYLLHSILFTLLTEYSWYLHAYMSLL